MVSENGLEMAMAAWFPRAALAVIGALLIGSGSMSAVALSKLPDRAFVYTLSTYTGRRSLRYSIVLKAVLLIVSGSFLVWVAITVHASPRLKKQYLRWTLMAWAGLQGLAFLLDLGQCIAHESLSNLCWGGSSFYLSVGLSLLCIVLVKREKLFWISLLAMGVGYLIVESSMKAYIDGDRWKERLPNSFNETLPHSIVAIPLFFLLIILIFRWRSSMRDADARIARAKDEYGKAWNVVTKQLSAKAKATSGAKPAAPTDHAGGNIQGEDQQQQQTHVGPFFSTAVRDTATVLGAVKMQPSRVLQGADQEQQQWVAGPELQVAGGGGGVGALEVRVGSGSSAVTGAHSGERESESQRASGSSGAAGQDCLSELAGVCRTVVEELRH
eukprot:3606820-Rhodomonas_salina.1